LTKLQRNDTITRYLNKTLEGENNMTAITNCPLCHNHCPAENLGCDKGKTYFSIEAGQLVTNGDGEESNAGKTDSRRNRRSDRGQEHNHEHTEKHGHESERGREGKREEHNQDENRDGKRHQGRKEDARSGHGRMHEERDEEFGYEQKDDLYSLMRACGHYLHRRSGHGDTQMKILRLLGHNGEMLQQDIQDILHIQAGSISEVITKLENKGLVERKKNEEDQRRIEIVITEEGKKAGLESSDEENTELFSVLDEKQKEELQESLKKLLEKWKENS
jgi:DNA-binding MarR family transcriptional regulator